MRYEFTIENITANAELGHRSSVSMEIKVNFWCNRIDPRTVDGIGLWKLFNKLCPDRRWIFGGNNVTNSDYEKLLDIIVTHMEWTRPYYFNIEGYIPFSSKEIKDRLLKREANSMYGISGLKSWPDLVDCSSYVPPTRVNLTTNTWHQDTIDYIKKYIIDDTNNTKKMFEEEVMGNTSKKFTAQDEHIRHANFRLGSLGIKKVIFNQNATIVIFNNGRKSVVKASEDDIYSKEAGVALALLKDNVGDECFHYILQALSGGKGNRVFDRDGHYIEIDDRNSNPTNAEVLGFFAKIWDEATKEVNKNDSEEK